MPPLDRIILTDVDGVLLDWDNHFAQWMRQKGFKKLKNTDNVYNIDLKYGIHKDLKDELIREFNKSAWMGTQQPMPDSQTWVKLLHAEGWTFIPITSQTSDIPAQELRKRRLSELFGNTVFENYFILETGEHKDSALAEFHGTYLWWIEDKWTNAKKGLSYGLRPIIYTHSYNQNFHNKKIVRVSNWQQIYKVVNGRK